MLYSLHFVIKLFSINVAVQAASANRFCKKQENFQLFNIAYTLLYSITNFYSTIMLCFVVPGAVYSNIPFPSCLHHLSKASYSPAQLQWMYLISSHCVSFKFFLMLLSYSLNQMLLLKNNSIIGTIFHDQQPICPNLPWMGN